MVDFLASKGLPSQNLFQIGSHEEFTLLTLKILKIRTPEKFAVIILINSEQHGFNIAKGVQNRQNADKMANIVDLF